MELNNKIVIYQTADGQTSIDVKLENETVWLSQAQMAELFQKDRTVIGRHINNIFKEGELDKEMVCAKFAHTTRHGAIADKEQEKELTLYSLDVIISVGYRVKSQRGTQFRIWANRILKDYLVKGYAVNKALTEQRYTELKQLVSVLGRTVKAQEALTTDDALSLVSVVSDYTYALDTLDKYDYQQLVVEQTTNEEKSHATYEGAMQAIEGLKAKFGGSQWFGNKRIAATLFLWFMAGNGILYNPDGTKRIADNTLVALTLMIAESRTEEKDVMVKVVVNLINRNN